ncbi:MAG: hypothetical protein K2N64_01345 [Anaeroplasmataceae bacterium]|nr:hypothetical protein [Anaeroplasmataceae bacterium]
MFERFKDCICHPRCIGKYNKDRAGVVFLTIVLFFTLCAGMLAARCYTDSPFTEAPLLSVTSKIIQHGDNDVAFDRETNTLSGTGFELGGTGIRLVVLPKDNQYSLPLDTVTLLLEESGAKVFYSNVEISSMEYKDITVSSFNLANVAANQSLDTYNFRVLVSSLLESTTLFFQTYSFVQEVISIIIFYLICVVFCYVLSIAMNPTIDRGVRAKLSFYDGCVFFVGSFFAYLFNVSIIIYFALALPLIYTLITFRHIIKIVFKG